jgi:two-component system, chemotaxis family, chemotaxis protein CheY
LLTGSDMNAPVDDVKALLGPIKVLIVDDDHRTRKVIHTLLLAIGCTKIYEAGDGAVGLEMVRAVAPDLVLVDWEMPGIDGPEFVRLVRSPETSPLPSVPVIMLTGHGERWRILEAVRLGVHEFLLKPVSRDFLRERILSVLAKSHSTAKRGDLYALGLRRASSNRPQADDAKARPRAAVKAAVDQ